MRLSVSMLFILAPLLNAWGQVVEIKDKVTHAPLSDVNIYSKNPVAAAVTNRHGRADISAFVGADSIVVSRIGYQRGVYSYAALASRNFVLYLEECSIMLDEVVVAAVRWQQPVRETPQKISSIRGTEIAFQNPQTAADLVGSSGEVHIQKSQLGGGSPMIRGFAANRVLIAVDGVRMNTAIFRSGNLQNVIALDPFATQSTELLFGPGSVIYGSDAIGGVMGFHTLLPEFASNGHTSIKGNFSARNSSANGEKTGHFDVNFGLQHWAFVSSVTLTNFDDQRMGSHGPKDYLRTHLVRRIDGEDQIVANPDPRKQVPTGYSQVNLMQKIRFLPHDKWELGYGFHYSRSSDVPRYDRLIEFRETVPRSAEWYYGPQKWLMHSLNVQTRAGKSWYSAARLTASLQKFEESRHDRRFGSSNLRHRTENVDLFSVNLDFEKSFRGHRRLYYGAELVFNRVGSKAFQENIESGARAPLSTRYPDGSTWNSYAAYVSYSTHLGPSLTVQAGFRYNLVTLAADFDTMFFPLPTTKTALRMGAITGSLGAIYNTSNNFNFSLNLATGFRAPNIDDIGKVFDSEPGAVVVPNPTLRPEYAYNVDIGVAKIFDESAKIDLTGYFTFLDNAMLRRDFSLNGQDSILYDGVLSRVQAIQNAGAAHVYGLQVGLEMKFPASFSLTSRFSYQKGKEKLEDGSNSPLRHAAPWFGTTHLIYRRHRLKADLYATYHGEIAFDDLAQEERGKPHLYAKDANGNPYSPGWYTLNFKLMVQVMTTLQLIAGIENITDQRYRPYSSGIAGPGRNFMASLRASF